MGVIPPAPPPELMAQVQAAAAHAERLSAAGLEVRFATRPGRRVSIEVRTSGGARLTGLTPRQAVELIPSPAG